MTHDQKSAVERFLANQNGGRATPSQITKGVGFKVNIPALVSSGFIRQARDSEGNVLPNSYELARSAQAGD